MIIFQLEECISAQQCGDLSKHAEEKQQMTDANDQVKKIDKDLKSKRADLTSKLAAQESIRMSFDHAIKTPLINSNKDKYLFQTAKGSFVPKTAVLQIDTAILSKHYNNKIPKDVCKQANLFQSIIGNFHSKYELSKSHKTVNPMKHKLEESGIHFPHASPSADEQKLAHRFILPAPSHGYTYDSLSPVGGIPGQPQQFILGSYGVIPHMLPYTNYGMEYSPGQSAPVERQTTLDEVKWNHSQIPMTNVPLAPVTYTSDTIQGVSRPATYVDYTAGSSASAQTLSGSETMSPSLSANLQPLYANTQQATDVGSLLLPPKKRKSNMF